MIRDTLAILKITAKVMGLLPTTDRLPKIRRLILQERTTAIRMVETMVSQKQVLDSHRGPITAFAKFQIHIRKDIMVSPVTTKEQI